MKTITKTINIYLFDELSEQAKQNAIETQRKIFYEYNDFLAWCIDNCYLLEPKHNELTFIKEYNVLKTPIFNNNRKIYLSLDRDRHIDISNALTITNEDIFYKWLGINKRLQNKITYTIKDDYIEFEENYYNYKPLTEREKQTLKDAEEKTKVHFQEVLDNIEDSYNYFFTDENIIEYLQDNEIEFTEDGNIFNNY